MPENCAPNEVINDKFLFLKPSFCDRKIGSKNAKTVTVFSPRFHKTTFLQNLVTKKTP